jgi:hypothetical protein
VLVGLPSTPLQCLSENTEALRDFHEKLCKGSRSKWRHQLLVTLGGRCTSYTSRCHLEAFKILGRRQEFYRSRRLPTLCKDLPLVVGHGLSVLEASWWPRLWWFLNLSDKDVEIAPTIRTSGLYLVFAILSTQLFFVKSTLSKVYVCIKACYGNLLKLVDSNLLKLTSSTN